MNYGEIILATGLLVGCLGAGAFLGHLFFAKRRMIPREKHHRGYGYGRERLDI